MSSHNNGSTYVNHERAAELHDIAAHAHRIAAEHRGKQDHQTGQEASRQALEHSERAFLFAQQGHQHGTAEHGFVTFVHADIAELALHLWRERGCPEGSPEEDWTKAVAQLRNRK